MILPDVNVLLYAFRADSVDQRRYREWLEAAVNGDGAYGMSPQVLCSVVRIATHPRAYMSPSRLDDAVAFARVLLEQPHCTVVAPGMRHISIFEDLCRGRRHYEHLSVPVAFHERDGTLSCRAHFQEIDRPRR